MKATQLYSLLAALFATTVISQILIQADIPWNYAAGTGPGGDTKAPVGTHVSKIDFYRGTTSGDYMSVQVYHGTSKYSTTKVPYTTGSNLDSSGAKDTLTLTATERITQVIMRSRLSTTSTGRHLYGFNFTLNDGSTTSSVDTTSPGSPESFTFVTPTDKEFAGFFLQDA